MANEQKIHWTYADDFGNSIGDAFARRDTDVLLDWSSKVARFVISGRDDGSVGEDALRHFKVV